MTESKDHETGTGKTGAKKQTWLKNPRELLAKIVRENPHISDDDLFEIFYDKIKSFPSMIETCIQYWFVNNLRSLRTRTFERKKIDPKLAEEVEEQIIINLLDVVLPNGKKLRDSTGLECKRAGSWYTRIGERIGDGNIVKDVLTNDDLRKIYQET